MAEKHEDNSKPTVEQNLAPDYVPKSKLGNLPISNQVDEELRKKTEKIQKEIEKYKDEINKKFKYIEAIGIIPAEANKKIEEEYEIAETDAKKGLIHIITVIPEKQFKNIGNIRLEAIKEAKKINEKFWVHIMTPVDIWNLGLDSKFEVLEAISVSMPIQDKGILASLRASQIHKSLVLKKFEKYVNSYVIYGSLTRGDTIKQSDVDIGIIIDDTDVKRMPRAELREKLRGIIYSYIQEAEAMAGVKQMLNVQIWLLTEFWEGVKDAHPLFFTFIRDGVPFYDRGTFLPWRSLLKMGKIKPSPEAIDMFMSSGTKLKETIQKRIFDVATLDLFWGINTPTQGVLMLYGLSPPTPKETVRQFREIFYEKEKLIEKKYVDILEEIVIKIWKGYEHGKVKPGDISGKELDRLGKNAVDYMQRIQKLRKQIEKRVQENSIGEVYKNTFETLENILNKKGEVAVIKEFDNKFIKTGKMPSRFLKNLKLIAKTKSDASKKVTTKKKKGKIVQNKDKRNEVSLVQRHSAEIINSLTEFVQRSDLALIEKTRYLIKGHDKTAEVLFLKDTFLVEGPKIQIVKDEKLKKSNPEELKKQLIDAQGKEKQINYKDLQTLEKVFGNFKLLQ